MGIFSGIGRALINPISIAQLAMGPAGWASLAVRTIGMAIGKEVIQQLGQKLGLPQSMISFAQTAFSAAAGGGKPDLASVLGRSAPSSLSEAIKLVAGQFNFSPAQEGNLARSANNVVGQLVQAMRDQVTADSKAAVNEKETKTSDVKGKGYLQALAEAMGATLDAKMDEITSLSDQVSTQAGANAKFNAGIAKDDNSARTAGAMQDNNQKLGSLNAKLQAATQELTIMQSAMSNALKTIGEAQSGMARKG